MAYLCTKNVVRKPHRLAWPFIAKSERRRTRSRNYRHRVPCHFLLPCLAWELGEQKKGIFFIYFLHDVGFITYNSFTNSSSKLFFPTGSVSLPEIPPHLRICHWRTLTSCKIFIKLVQTHSSTLIFFATLVEIAQQTSQLPSLSTSIRRIQKPPTCCRSYHDCSYLMSKR